MNSIGYDLIYNRVMLVVESSCSSVQKSPEADKTQHMVQEECSEDDASHVAEAVRSYMHGIV